MGNRRNRGKKNKNKYKSYVIPVPTSAEEAKRPIGWVSPYNYTSTKQKGKTFRSYRTPQRGDKRVEQVFDVAEEIFGGSYWCVGSQNNE